MSTVEEPVEIQLPTRAGEFRAVGHGYPEDGGVTFALIHGDLAIEEARIVRSHTACLLGDTFGSLLCDCRERLEDSIQEILDAGAGVLLYRKPPVSDLSCPNGAGRREAVGSEVAVVRAELAAVEPSADPL
jgi:GTP cyclohydrolase II